MSRAGETPDFDLIFDDDFSLLSDLLASDFELDSGDDSLLKWDAPSWSTSSSTGAEREERDEIEGKTDESDVPKKRSLSQDRDGLAAQPPKVTRPKKRSKGFPLNMTVTSTKPARKMLRPAELALVNKIRALISLLKQICDAANAGDDVLVCSLCDQSLEDTFVMEHKDMIIDGKEAMKAHYLQSMRLHPDGLREYHNIRFQDRAFIIDFSFSGTKQYEVSDRVDLFSKEVLDEELRRQVQQILSSGDHHTYSFRMCAILTFTPNTDLTKFSRSRMGEYTNVTVSPVTLSV